LFGLCQTAEKANELHDRDWFKSSYQGRRATVVTAAVVVTGAHLSGEARWSRSRTMEKLTKVSWWRFWKKKGTVSEAQEVKVEKVG